MGDTWPGCIIGNAAPRWHNRSGRDRPAAGFALRSSPRPRLARRPEPGAEVWPDARPEPRGGGPDCLDPRGGGGVLHDLFVTPFGGGAVRPRRGQLGESRCFDVTYDDIWVEDDGPCEAQVRSTSGGVPRLEAVPPRHWSRRGIGADAALDRGSCRSGPCPVGAWCPGEGHSSVPRAKHGMPIPPVAVMLAEGLPVLGNGVRCRAGAGGTELAGLLRKT